MSSTTRKIRFKVFYGMSKLTHRLSNWFIAKALKP